MIRYKYKLVLCVFLSLAATLFHAQNIDIGSIGKGKAFKLSGGISANSIFYNSSQASEREAFTYFVQGNLSVGFYQFSMPHKRNDDDDGLLSDLVAESAVGGFGY